MSTTGQPRNLTIDVARGLGMLAIVWGHNAYVHNPPDEVFRVLFSFHVPLFFCLAGAMLPMGTPVFTRCWHAAARALLQPYAVVLGTLLVVGAAKQWRSRGRLGLHTPWPAFKAWRGAQAARCPGRHCGSCRTCC
jgi:fucose 4-O-acetylase-like acetyltransferase